jgi:hypothetical protein
MARQVKITGENSHMGKVPFKKTPPIIINIEIAFSRFNFCEAGSLAALVLKSSFAVGRSNRLSAEKGELPLFADLQRKVLVEFDCPTPIIGSGADSEVGTPILHESSDLAVPSSFKGSVIGTVSASRHNEQRNVFKPPFDDRVSPDSLIQGPSQPNSSFPLVYCNHSAGSITQRKVR